MSDLDALESVLAKDGALIAAVGPDQLSAPTPCPEYAVHDLVNHLVRWVKLFDASANGRSFDIEAAPVESDDPATDFQRSATSLISGWRSGGVDRTVPMTGGDLPAQMVLSMTLMEYLAHGCDLAMATGQPVPFSDTELAIGLERAQGTLPEQYRGEGQPFGLIIDVPDAAPVLHRFLGFMGRAA